MGNATKTSEESKTGKNASETAEESKAGNELETSEEEEEEEESKPAEYPSASVAITFQGSVWTIVVYIPKIDFGQLANLILGEDNPLAQHFDKFPFALNEVKFSMEADVGTKSSFKVQ